MLQPVHLAFGLVDEPVDGFHHQSQFVVLVFLLDANSDPCRRPGNRVQESVRQLLQGLCQGQIENDHENEGEDESAEKTE